MNIDYLLKDWRPEEMRTLNDVDSIYVNDRFMFFLRNGHVFETVEIEDIDYFMCFGKVKN